MNRSYMAHMVEYLYTYIDCIIAFIIYHALPVSLYWIYPVFSQFEGKGYVIVFLFLRVLLGKIAALH